MKPEDYKKALSTVALGEEEEERLAAAVIKKLEKKRQKKRIVRRVLVPVFSAAALCIVAVPLAIAWAPAGAPAGSEPDHSRAALYRRRSAFRRRPFRNDRRPRSVFLRL